MMRSLAPLACALTVFYQAPAHASDDYAAPPGEPRPSPDNAAPFPGDFEPEESALRLSTGPVLRATPDRVDGGFSAAIDIGARASGARFAGSWLRMGSARGLSQYDAQLWVDFGAGQRWHPILAAGAGLARLESGSAPGSARAASVGIGLLRGTLEYVLPIREANARAGLDLEGALPAIAGSTAPDTSGWLLITARVGVGF